MAFPSVAERDLSVRPGDRRPVGGRAPNRRQDDVAAGCGPRGRALYERGAHSRPMMTCLFPTPLYYPHHLPRYRCCRRRRSTIL